MRKCLCGTVEGQIHHELCPWPNYPPSTVYWENAWRAARLQRANAMRAHPPSRLTDEGDNVSGTHTDVVGGL